VLGNIQPFGFLVTAGMDWIVRRASANTAAFLNVEPGKLLGTPLAALFSENALHAIRNRITLLRRPGSVERLFHLALTENGPPFDVAVHFSGDQIVIEAEPAQDSEIDAGKTARRHRRDSSGAAPRRALCGHRRRHRHPRDLRR
jgi:light-regulated signal transduction histidine kinase (bacteriophytochrome)